MDEAVQVTVQDSLRVPHLELGAVVEGEHAEPRVLATPSEKRLKRAPTPALIKLSGIGFVILGMPDQDGM